jgi:hypothetical protein
MGMSAHQYRLARLGKGQFEGSRVEIWEYGLGWVSRRPVHNPNRCSVSKLDNPLFLQTLDIVHGLPVNVTVHVTQQRKLMTSIPGIRRLTRVVPQQGAISVPADHQTAVRPQQANCLNWLWPSANQVPCDNYPIYIVLLQVVQHGFQSR